MSSLGFLYSSALPVSSNAFVIAAALSLLVFGFSRAFSKKVSQ